MYSPVRVRLARFQRWSPRLVRVKGSIRWISAERVCESLCGFCSERERNGSELRRRRRRRAHTQEPENTDSNGEFKSSLSLPSDARSSLSLSVFLSAVDSSSFPLCFYLSHRLCVLMPFPHAHKRDMLPSGKQTSAADVSTPKRKGETHRAIKLSQISQQGENSVLPLAAHINRCYHMQQ